MDIRHLIDIIDFTPAEIDELIATAEDIIENPAKYQDVCAHKQLATLFFEPSTRTRLSFESAMLGLGGVPFVNGNFVYYLTSYLPVLCVAAVASTPVGVKAFRRLPVKIKEIAGVLLVLAGLVVCTAYLVDGTYNPFLYFRF